MKLKQGEMPLGKDMSPSTRREWIEIISGGDGDVTTWVSLHAEGVD